jgi:hypothetical protein
VTPFEFAITEINLRYTVPNPFVVHAPTVPAPHPSDFVAVSSDVVDVPAVRHAPQEAWNTKQQVADLQKLVLTASRFSSRKARLCCDNL